MSGIWIFLVVNHKLAVVCRCQSEAIHTVSTEGGGGQEDKASWPSVFLRYEPHSSDGDPNVRAQTFARCNRHGSKYTGWRTDVPWKALQQAEPKEHTKPDQCPLRDLQVMWNDIQVFVAMRIQGHQLE